MMKVVMDAHFITWAQLFQEEKYQENCCDIQTNGLQTFELNDIGVIRT